MTSAEVNGTKVWTLVGLVSAGFSCARAFQPGIYHRVASSSDWISYVSRSLDVLY